MCGENGVAECGFVPDDTAIVLEIVKARQPVIERNEVAQSIHGFGLVMSSQFVVERNAVNRLSALVQFLDAKKNALVLLKREVVGRENGGDLTKGVRVVERR